MEALILLLSVAANGAMAGLGGPGTASQDRAAAPGAPHDDPPAGAAPGCDGTDDDGSAMTWFADRDGDGWGDWDVQVQSCSAGLAPVRVTDRAGDCDDGDADISPHAAEVPGNGVDEDCDGMDAPLHVARHG